MDGQDKSCLNNDIIKEEDIKEIKEEEVNFELVKNENENDEEDSFLPDDTKLIKSCNQYVDDNKSSSQNKENVDNYEYGMKQFAYVNADQEIYSHETEENNQDPLALNTFTETGVESESIDYSHTTDGNPTTSDETGWCDASFILPDKVIYDGNSILFHVKNIIATNSALHMESDYNHQSSSSSTDKKDQNVDVQSEKLSDILLNERELLERGVGLGVIRSDKRKKKIYDKRDSCLYCEKMCSKLIHHLEAIHSKEKEVAMFLKQKKKSKERKNMIQNIRHKGNFIYNKKVCENKSGHIIPYRRQKVENSKYLPCEYCFGFFKMKRLYRHVAKCCNNPSGNLYKGHSISRSLTLLTAPSTTSTELRKVLDTMKTDKESLTVRNDDLIMKYGEWLCAKNVKKKHLKNDNSQKMRELARLMIKLQENEDFSKLTNALKPEYFFKVIDAVKGITGIDCVYGKKRFSLALKIGYSLQKCLQILKSEAIVEKNDSKIKEVDDFLQLYHANWHNLIVKKTKVK